MNVVEVAIEPTSQSALAALDAALDRLRQSRPSIGIRLDTESGQTVLSGKTVEDLDDAVSAIIDARADVRAGQPHVVYRETISKRVPVLYTHKKFMGGRGEFAEVEIEFEPLPSDSGFAFENRADLETVPARFIPGIEKGLRKEAEGGLLVGFPVTDCRARLVDGKYHEIDSTPLTFEIAARAAFRTLSTKGVVRLTEPIMKIEVLTPDDHFGRVIGDLNARRGQVHGMEARGNGQLIVAMVPMSGLFEYSDALRSVTDGRGQWSMSYDHYEVVPAGGDDDPRFPGAAAARVA